MTTPPDYNDGKTHAWSGGECPVHPKSTTDATTGDKWAYGVPAGKIFWHQPLLFRVTDQHIEPPKPLELWVNVYPSGNVSAYRTAARAAVGLAVTGRTVHMIEVTE